MIPEIFKCHLMKSGVFFCGSGEEVIIYIEMKYYKGKYRVLRSTSTNLIENRVVAIAEDFIINWGYQHGFPAWGNILIMRNIIKTRASSWRQSFNNWNGIQFRRFSGIRVLNFWILLLWFIFSHSIRSRNSYWKGILQLSSWKEILLRCR